tara:strand:- start:80 stop:268 length:189 start_codon:yes stop_codon:yes gene_type:complete
MRPCDKAGLGNAAAAAVAVATAVVSKNLRLFMSLSIVFVGDNYPRSELKRFRAECMRTSTSG